MSRIVFEDNYVIVIPSFKEVLSHKHNFYHIFFLVNDESCNRFYVVGENMRHRMPPLDKCKLFLMIDPTSDLAERLKTDILVDGKPVIVDCYKPVTLVKDMSDVELRTFVSNCLCDNKFVKLDTDDCQYDDYRVIKLIQEIKEYKHLEKSIQEIADKYKLSDSRLSHSFKTCVGVSLKGYLNIKQMQYAYKLIMDGESITYAALEAGFSSPAHLAAICKKQMGISISMVLK